MNGTRDLVIPNFGRLGIRLSLVAALLVASCAENEASVETVPPIDAPTSVVPYTPPTDASPSRVLFAGDSLTAGAYATTPDRTFPALVAASLGGPVQPVMAYAAGKTLITVNSVIDVPPDLDLAVLELGTNDYGATPLSDFEATYHDLVKRVRSTSPSAALVCVGVWNADGGPYDEAIEAACTSGGGKFVPVSWLYTPDPYRGPAGVPTFMGGADALHPNDTGHGALAGAILASLPH